MKVCFALAFAFVAVSARPRALDDDSWLAFKSQFGKQYESQEEEQYRMKIWEKNTEFVHTHNKRNSTFTVAINQFGDLTDEEFGFYYLNPAFYYSSHRFNASSVFSSEGIVAEATVDWRQKGYVTPIKNQGACGSCWAFSTTGSLEGQHFKATGKLVSLSEQNLVDCSKPEGNDGCRGGLMDRAFDYIKVNHGIDTEESYPYTARDGVCHFKESSIGATLTSWTDIERDSEEDLMHAVSRVGPVSVAMDASRTSFRFYHSGIYKDPECSSTRLDHGVLAVGYGKGEAEGGAYWIVKNSWGTSWGDMGYFKMAKDDNNMCGIATQASYPVV